MRRRWLFLSLLVSTARPAAAGEQIVPGAPADALALLMADQRILIGDGATLPDSTMLALLLEDRRVLAGSALPRRLPDTPALPPFEAVAVSAPQVLVLTVPMSGWRVPPTPPRRPLTAQEIVGRSMPALGPRRPSLLSATLILRIDDKEETPLLAMGGAAAMLNPLIR